MTLTILRRAVAFVLALAAILTGSYFGSIGGAHAQPSTSQDWTTYLGSNARTGFNAAETAITPQSAPTLAVRWNIHLPGLNSSISAQPLVSQGFIYWGGWDGVMRATGMNAHLLWRTSLGTTTVSSCLPTTVGVASTGTLADTSVMGTPQKTLFVGGGDAAFYALNAWSGQILWKTALGQANRVFLWSSPALYNGSVYEGVSSFGDCPLVPGRLVQMDASTGQVRHMWWAVPSSCKGAGIWGSPTIDEATGTIFVTTGNPGACSRPETNAASVVALRASDLSVLGSWTVPRAERTVDDDFGSTPTLFSTTGENDGAPRLLVGVANKNGIFYAFDRSAIGAGPVWQMRLGIGGDCPQCGAAQIAPAAWDGSHLFVGTNETLIKGIACNGSVQALDPATGKPIWQQCVDTVLGAVMAAPGIVEVGAGSRITVLDAMTGAPLFQYPIKTGALLYGPGTISNGLLLHGDVNGTLHVLAPNR